MSKLEKNMLVRQFSVLRRVSLVLALWFVDVGVHAGQLPLGGEPVEIDARGVELTSLLKSIFSGADLRVIVGDSVGGRVSGTWNSDVAEILKDLKITQSLSYYYDGSVAFVYPQEDMKTLMLPADLNTQRAVVRVAEKLKLTDQENTLKQVDDIGLVVSGVPRFLEQIDEILVAVAKRKKIRANPIAKVPASTTVKAAGKRQISEAAVGERLYYLKHAWAHDTVLEVNGANVKIAGIASILSGMVGVGNSQASGHSVSFNPGTGDPVEEPRLGLKSGSNDAGPVNAKISESVGVPKILAVPRLNAVLIRDRLDRLDDYARIIANLDVVQKMLEIEATIIDIDTTASRELGIDMEYRNNNTGGYTNTGLGDSPLGRPNTFGDKLQGGVIALASGDQTQLFLARIRALEQEGSAEIVSSPRIVTLSNVEAILDSSETFYVRVAASDDASLFRISTGTVLRVTPHVYRADNQWKIRLIINIKDGAASSATVDGIPVVGNTNINTQAVVESGASLLIGGMAREITRKTEAGVPLFRKIPVIGALFRNRGESVHKVERLFLLSPKLLDGEGVVQSSLATGGQKNPEYLSALVSTDKASGLSRPANSGGHQVPIKADGLVQDKQWLDPFFGHWESLEFVN